MLLKRKLLHIPFQQFDARPKRSASVSGSLSRVK